MDFAVFHKYNRLVRRGMATPLTCSCNYELVIGIGFDENPVLKCYSCGARVTPGLQMYESLVKHVESFK